MQHEIYITEPGVIDSDEVRKLLPEDGYTITAGTRTFDDAVSSQADTLLIRSGTIVKDDIKQYFPGLKSVVRVGTGLDNVDLEYCRQAGISVYNAPGANADAVAEYVTTMILYVYRHLYMMNRKDIAGWQRMKFMGESVAGKTIGIVGFGNIGKLLQKKLTGLGCTEYIVYDPYLTEEVVQAAGATFADLDTLLSRSDVVSLHLPLTDETRHLIGTSKLSLLKDDAILINAARGGIVDEAALLEIMESKPLNYIADTVEGEPEVNPGLLDHERVFITPHIASLTSASDAAMLTKAIENYLADIVAR